MPFAPPLSSLKTLTLPSDADPMNPVVRDVGEEDIALAVHRRPFGQLVSLADEFPVVAGIENLAYRACRSEMRRCRRDRLR